MQQIVLSLSGLLQSITISSIMPNPQTPAREFASIDTMLQPLDRAHMRPSRISWAAAPLYASTDLENQSDIIQEPSTKTRWARIKLCIQTRKLKFWLWFTLGFVIFLLVIAVAVGITKLIHAVSEYCHAEGHEDYCGLY
jgi:hypothetical protein